MLAIHESMQLSWHYFKIGNIAATRTVCLQGLPLKNNCNRLLYQYGWELTNLLGMRTVRNVELTSCSGKLEGILPTDNISVRVLNKSCIVLNVWGTCFVDSNRTAEHYILPLIYGIHSNYRISIEAYIICKLYTASAIFMYQDILPSQWGVNDCRGRNVGNAALPTAFTWTDLLLLPHFM